MGHPMSHSTHWGFSAPPTAFGSCSPFVPPPLSLYGFAFGWRQSLAAGDGQVRIATTVSKFGKRVGAFSTALSVNVAAIAEQLLGVGQSRVGNKEESVSPVRGANG